MNNKIRSILFAGILISISIFNIVLPTKSFSSKENRYLQSFPELNKEDIMSGSFATDFEKYSTDQFISRDLWISLKTIIDLGLQKKDNGRVYFGKEDYLFDVDDDINEEQMYKNIDSINKLLDKIKNIDKDIKISTLLIPAKSQIFGDKLPKYAPLVNENELLEIIRDSLRPNIKVIDLMDILRDKNDEYIYYKTDHHWTSKGAYYGYRKYLEAMNVKPLYEKDFDIENVANDFYGTSYRKANLFSSKPDDIFIYKSKEKVDYEILTNDTTKTNNLYDNTFLNKTDKYSYFLGGDKAIVEIETSLKNDKTILVLKDSFANSLIPFLTNNYEKIFVIDTRYYNGSIAKYIETNKVDEVLFLYGIQNFLQEKTFTKLGL